MHLIGQGRQEAQWIEALASGRMAHAWLLAGPKGVGKAAFARRSATFLMADGDRRASAGATTLDVDANDPAVCQIANGSHPDFIWLQREIPETKRPKDGGPGKDEDLARTISIFQVRSVLARLRLRPANARWRAVVVDSMDDLERGGANALLKTLEEPPANTIFLLISHQPGRLMPTIRSRCRLLRFAALDDAAMRHFCEANLPALEDQERDTLIAIANGSPGRAIQFAGSDLGAVAEALNAIAASGDGDNRLRAELVRAVSGKGTQRVMEVLLVHAEMLAAQRARAEAGARLLLALNARDRIVELSREAETPSADYPAIAFAVGSALASTAG